MKDSVVITGCGGICGSGLGVGAIWDAVMAGRSAVKAVTRWDVSRWPVRLAAEVVEIEERALVNDRRLQKIVSRTDLFGIYAADAAIQQSGLLAFRERLGPDAAAPFNDRSGVFAGSGGGTYQSNYDFFPLLTEAAGDMGAFGRELTMVVDPMWLLRRLPNNVVCHVGIRSGFKGTNACVTNQCVGGVQAIAEAAASIQAGEADRAVAVAHDAPIEPETLLYYHQVGLIAPDALRPFDAQRGGTVLGEGAAALVLETAAAARARGVPLLGEILGFGCTTEATGVLEVRPDGDGLSRAIELALGQAGVAASAVGMIVAHGNGTASSDASEAAAILRVFGGDPPPVTAFKWAFGHLLAASGALDVVLALRALAAGVVPGVATLQGLDPALGPLPVSAAPQRPRSDVALALCRGFGGMNVALLVRAPVA